MAFSHEPFVRLLVKPNTLCLVQNKVIDMLIQSVLIYFHCHMQLYIMEILISFMA